MNKRISDRKIYPILGKILFLVPIETQLQKDMFNKDMFNYLFIFENCLQGRQEETGKPQIS